MRVLLIPGHGDGDPGVVRLGYKESDIVRELAPMIQTELSRYCAVDVADQNKNWYRHIITNKQYFNFKNYDYVAELHVNSNSKNEQGNGKTTGAEIYVPRNEKIVTVEEKILSNISSLGFKNRGVKFKNYDLIYHIKNQGVSSALIEVFFLDDKDDVLLYQSRKKEVAGAIAKGIAEGYNLKEKEKQMADYSNHWASEEIKKVLDLGIMNGYPDKSFNPDKPMTRAEMAVVVTNVLNYLKEK